MSDKLGCISDIDVNAPPSWEGKYFLSFDIDWAEDAVISLTADILEDAHAKATFFVTHDTPVLDRLRENPNFELGIHPNFNHLLGGSDANGKDMEEVVDRLLELVPEAKAVRSHSATVSSFLLQLFDRKGLVYDCKYFVHHSSGNVMGPWTHWNGMIEVPYVWADDVACTADTMADYAALSDYKGIRVMDFHPIHIYLKTDVYDRYERSRAAHRDMEAIKAHINTQALGSQDVLKKILEQS